MIKKGLTRKKLASSVLHALGMTALVFMGKAAYAGIHKSPNDHRELQTFKLTNELSVLLISDPETDKAAAAMNIAVGSNADPKARPGLAHFLEHMLFLGTQKYPDAGAYKAYIQSHGGHMNAYTAHENTNYYFDIASDNLEPALDRFAQFFIAPLLDEKYVDRERHAVHSEYKSKIRDDRRRSYAVTKQVMNPSHSFSHFDVGTIKTLGGDVRTDLVEFYDQYYSSNLMTLVVEGKESIPELKQMVEKLFSAVPNKQAEPINVDAPLFETGTLPAHLNIKSLKDNNTLALTFPVESVRDSWQEKPLFYISDLVGYEGHGSLLAYLKEQGYANGLSTSTGIDLKDQAAFKVKIELTDTGLKQQQKVIEAFFSYMDLIRRDGIQLALYQEQRRLRDAEFRFHQGTTPMKEVSHLAAMMQRFPVEHVFDAPYVMERFDVKQIKSYLDQISPNNMLITTQSPDVKTDRIDPWYNTGYRVDALHADQLARWQNPTIVADLNVRSRNPFMADEMVVKANTDDADISRPEVVFERNGMRLWHLQDTEFNTPKANTYFSVATPNANSSVEHAIMTALYTQMVSDRLNESLYDAELAGLSTRIYSHMRGFSVRVSGYSDKQSVLLKTVTSSLKDTQFDPQRFTMLKDAYRDELLNTNKDRPFNQTMRELFRLLLPQWSAEEKVAALDGISLKDIENFVPNLFRESNIQMMTHGNLTTDDSIALARIVEDQFVPAQQATPEVESPVVKLSDGKPLIQTLDIRHNDSAISVYYQGEDTQIKTHAKFSLLSELVSSDFYTQLRTEKQLGYIVFGTPIMMVKTPGLALVVQSPVAEPQILETHIKNFVSDLETTLRNLNPMQLDRLKQSVISKVLKQDKNLTARSNRFWKDIDDESLDFDSHEALANAVADLSIDDLIDCYEGLTARQLVVRSYGQKHKAENGNSAEIGKRCDTEIKQKKQKQEFFET